MNRSIITFNFTKYLYTLAAFCAFMFCIIWCTAWLVRHAVASESNQASQLSTSQARWVRYVTGFPGLARSSITEFRSRLSADPLPLLIQKIPDKQTHWIRHFPEPSDPGYLLFSGVDSVAKKSVVKLIKISDGAVVAIWDPDWRHIFKHLTPKKDSFDLDYTRARAVHPLLLDDGDIVFNNLVSLVRMNICSSRPMWILDLWADHSVELDLNGTIWTQSFAGDGFSENPWLQEHLRDDSLLNISTDGNILENRSFARILRENGLGSLVLGRSDFSSQRADPIHLNEIQVALLESKYWKRGDLLISARNLSTLFLYRPSTGKILWHKTGPWLNQHSAEFVNNHAISVFDNNIILGPPVGYSFMLPSDTNRVLVYDFESGQISQPFANLLSQTRPITRSQGRARILPDGGLFIEETDYGRNIRFTNEKLLWSRINDYDGKRTGDVAWSRYLTAEEASRPLQALATKRCGTR